MSFKSTRWHGVAVTVHAALAENAGPARNMPLYQAAVDYQAGPWRAGYAGLLAKPDRASATVRENVSYHNVYLNYRYGSGTLYAAAVRSNNATNSTNGLTAGTILSNTGDPSNHFAGTDPNARRYFNIWQLSADYRASPRLRIGMLYGRIRDTSGGNAGASGGNIGAYYALSARTTLYGFANRLRNERNGGFRFLGSAGPGNNLAGDDVNGRKLTGIQAGILHKF